MACLANGAIHMDESAERSEIYKQISRIVSVRLQEHYTMDKDAEKEDGWCDACTAGDSAEGCNEKKPAFPCPVYHGWEMVERDSACGGALVRAGT